MFALGKKLKKSAAVGKVLSNKYATRMPTGDTASRASLGRAAITEIFRGPGSSTTVPPVIPMADEEELERVRRRRAAKRTGGRSSTVLSDDDALGG